jgi:HlyD family secretion protein
MKSLGIIAALVALFIGYVVFHDTMKEDGAYLGYVEGDILYIGPVEGERLGALSAEAGDRVTAGALLFEMETPLLEAQRREAADRISQMQAQVENLQAALNRPQQVAVLEAAVERRKAELLLSQQNFERQKTLFARKDVSKAMLDNAQMALSRDEANLTEAQRQVDAALLTGRSQEIRAAEAAMQQARSALGQLNIRIERQRVYAPAAGVVQDVFFRRGEMVTAGQPVLSLLPPENRKARFYVPQSRLPEIKLGGRVRVACDGCADNLYAKIFYISGREEFTPPVIFSDEERQKLVFKIEARMEGAARELPLGLPLRIYPAAQAAK